MDEENEPFEFVRHRGKLHVIVGDTMYQVTKGLREGAADLLAGVPWNFNPHGSDTNVGGDWEEGHVLASAIPKLAQALAGNPVDQLASLGEAEQ